MAIAQALQIGSNGSGTTVTLTGINVGSGTDRYLLVCTNDQGSGASAITGVKYAGVSMQILVGPTQFGPTANNNWLTVWGLHNPTSGSNSVVISQGSSVATFNDIYAITGAFQGTNPIDSVDTSVILQGDNHTGTHNQSVTTSNDGCGIVSFCFNDFNTNVYSVGTKVTDNGGGATAITSPFPQSTHGSATFTWTITGANSSTNWAAATVAIKPVATSSFTPTPMLHLLQMAGGIV